MKHVVEDTTKYLWQEVDNDIVKFLSALFQSGLEERYIEIRTLKAPNQFFVPIQLSGFKYIANTFSGRESVYFGVHPRFTAEGTSQAVKKARVFFIDLDPLKNDAALDVEAFNQALKEKGLDPTAVVFSGRGYHIYFVNEYELETDAWTIYQKELIQEVDSILSYLTSDFKVDIKVSDLARILRLPNTINEKNGEKASIVFFDESNVIDIEKTIKINKQDNNDYIKNYLVRDLYEVIKDAYKEGQRQQAVLYFAGYCSKSNIPIDVCKSVVMELCKNEPKSEQKRRLQAVYYSYSKTSSMLIGASGLEQLGVNVRKLNEITNNSFQQFKTNVNNLPKVTQVYNLFMDKFGALIYREKSDFRNTMLYFYNGYYFEPFYENSDFFVNLVTMLTRELFGVIQADFSTSIYRNLLVEPQLQIVPDWGQVIAFKNKVFDLSTCTFKDISPSFGQRFVINANVNEDLFVDAMEKEDWYASYLHIIDKTQHFKYFIESLEFSPETLQRLIETAGYIMLPRLKRFNKEIVFILTGEGANGKSTFLDLIKQLFGFDEKFVASVSLSDLEGFHLAGLIGKYVNIANEITEKGDKTVAIENLKRTVSWDLMEIPVKHRDHLFTRLLLVHLFAVNTMPRLTESTNAVWRRFQLIEFKKIIPREKRDPNILSKLLTEIDLIATLFLLGAYKVATTMQIDYTDVSDLRILNNPVIEYLDENYTPSDNPDDYIKLNELRKQINDYLGRVKYGDLISFIPALKDAVDYLASFNSSWRNVKIVKDTEIGPHRLRSVLRGIASK